MIRGVSVGNPLNTSSAVCNVRVSGLLTMTCISSGNTSFRRRSLSLSACPLPPAVSTETRGWIT